LGERAGRGPQRGPRERAEPATGQREAALEAQGHQQVQREELGDGRRHLQVGAQRTGQDAEDEEQDGGIEQALHGALVEGLAGGES